MSDELVFYTHPMSRGRIIRWMLEEVGEPYRTEVLDFGGTMKSAEYLAVNPMGKVPALRHGEAVVTEAGAICAYLADAFPQAGLAPPHGHKDRAAYYRWMFFAAGPLEQATTALAFGWEVPPERKGMIGSGALAEVLDAIERAVDGRAYLAGDRFSAADLYLGAHLGWGMMMGSIDKRPAFEAYASRFRSRPAAVRAQEIDDGLAASLAPPK
jgi:glutathione S-transferase